MNMFEIQSERYRNSEITLSAEKIFKDDSLMWQITAKHIYTGIKMSAIAFGQIGGARKAVKLLAVKLLDKKLDLIAKEEWE